MNVPKLATAVPILLGLGIGSVSALMDKSQSPTAAALKAGVIAYPITVVGLGIMGGTTATASAILGATLIASLQ